PEALGQVGQLGQQMEDAVGDHGREIRGAEGVV
ncbi:MAG: hypothetical protein AVDCRST_MAG38-683, partial [uncultured Solirubrobacteraceae bacterium]